MLENTFQRDTFFLEKKKVIFKVPKNKVVSIKRKKFSILKTGITLTLVTAGTIFYIDQADEDTPTERLIPN